MAKQQILLVDADASSARVLEVSLRGVGFTVTTAKSAELALEHLEHGAPDLILSDTRLPEMDGFELVKQIRRRSSLADVPIVFLTEQGALDQKLLGLGLGVDDYLAKPIFVREVVSRVQALLARQNRRRLEADSQARTRFSGSLEDMAVVDLLQTVGVSNKSGIAVVSRGGREVKLYFRNGQLVDAATGELRGEEAVYRALTWVKGRFDLEVCEVDVPSVIETSTNALLMEGLRRADEMVRLSEQLPDEESLVDVDHPVLLERLPEIPDELNEVLRLIDGRRSFLDLIDDSPFDDLSTLTVLSKFYFEGLLLVREPRSKGDLGRAERATRLTLSPSQRRSSKSEPPETPRKERSTLVPAAPISVTRRPTRPPQVLSVEPSLPTVSLSGRPPSLSLTEDAVAAASSGRTIAPGVATPQVRSPVPSVPAGKLAPKVIVKVGDSNGEGDPPRSEGTARRAPSNGKGSSEHDTGRATLPSVPNGSGTLASRSSLLAAGVIPVGRAVGSSTVTGVGPPSEPSRSVQTVLESPSPALALRADSDPSGAAEPAAPTPSKHESVAPSKHEPVAPSKHESSKHELVKHEPVKHEPVKSPTDGDGSEALQADLPPASEAEFFDQGDEGTYEGGPRSIIPSELPPELDEVAPASLRPPATPEQEARVRRNKRLALLVLGLFLLPALLATWKGLVGRSTPVESAAAGSVEDEVMRPSPPTAAEGAPASESAHSVTAPASDESGGERAAHTAGAEGESHWLEGTAPAELRPEATTPSTAPAGPAAPGTEPSAPPAPPRTQRAPAPRVRAPAQPRPDVAPAAPSSPRKPAGAARRSVPAPKKPRSLVRKPPTASFPMQ